MVLNVRAY